MSRTADFLVEIGTEELPPKALPVLERAFANHLEAAVQAAGLGGQAVESFATPRRLAVRIRSLGLTQPDRQVEKRGPPISAAFGPDGQPTKAATAFAAGCGVAVADLERVETPKGAWLIYRGVEAGQPAAALLPAMVEAALVALPVPRRMRWGAGDEEFVRPVHWLVMLLGNEVVPATILGQTAGATTRGHRFHCPTPLRLDAPAGYEDTLLGGKVVAGFAARRQRVHQLVVDAAGVAGGTAVVDAELLDEVTALVEWPVAVTGRFAEEFLQLPDEVLIATLQGHQRYFPVRDDAGRLLPIFITLSNLESRDPDQVRAGNERVVRPRLTDAAFFWEQDGATTLASRLPQLEQVVYQRGLGSLRERAVRVGRIAGRLAGPLGADVAEVERAAELAKTDLLTQMVGEFPELQGRIGYYYALRDGESAAVATAVEEQYLPRHAGDRLPSSATGRALAIADRLDALAGAFALGKRPSGNKDPFGLRRAALGLLRILIEDGVELNVPDLLEIAAGEQPVKDANPPRLRDDIYDFLLERLRSWYLEGLAPNLPAGTVSHEIFEAVRLRRPVSPLDFQQRVMAVRAFVALPEADSLASANKRIANILRSADSGSPANAVDPELFESPAERALAEAVEAIAAEHRDSLAQRDYEAVLRRLARLKESVDAFFDAVLVMTDDLPRRQNRLALLNRLRDMFLDVADLSVLPAS